VPALYLSCTSHGPAVRESAVRFRKAQARGLDAVFGTHSAGTHRPANRLPVRILTVTADDGESGLQADVRWLSPTAANLAKLTVPILAGFTEVPAPVTAG
jgi:hypothetical protein